MRVCVCVWCNTVAVYPGPLSKQLVPICFFFYSCGLWLREWGALACGVWVWTNSGEVCAAGVCVCVWMWFMASQCSCVYMWFRTQLVCVCVCVCVDLWVYGHVCADYACLCVCVHLARAASCMPVCVCECVWWLAIITLYIHFNIVDTQSYFTANISQSARLPSYCMCKLSHDAVCSKSDSLRRSVQSFH